MTMTVLRSRRVLDTWETHPAMNPVDKLNVIVLAVAGGLAAYVAYRDERLGAALVVGATVVTLLYMLLLGG